MKTKKYQVLFQRTEYYDHLFEIEATSKDDAYNKAFEAANDHNFHEGIADSASEEVLCVTEVP
jgi:hypothetical protein